VPVAFPVPEFAGHAEHAVEPVAALNEWAKHAVKGPPSGPVYPAFATQAVLAVDPTLAPVPEFVGHAEHAAEPVPLNEWAKHAVKGPPSGPVYPAFATQAVLAALPVPEFVGQAEHAAEPVAALNEWAKHAVKGPPSGPVYPAFATQAVLAVDPTLAPVPELLGQAVHGVPHDASAS
jgi:hypothetical protein